MHLAKGMSLGDLASSLNRNLTYLVKWWDENLTDPILRQNGWRGSVSPYDLWAVLL